MAKRTIEKYALDKNEIAGFPVYKDKRMGLWLVPIFDKKTNKFKGSIYVSDGSIFIMGPGSYSEYKKIISGKTGHKSDTNKKHKTDKSNSNISNKTSTKKIVVEGKSNFDISSNSNMINEQQNTNFEESAKSDLNHEDLNIECDIQLNVTG